MFTYKCVSGCSAFMFLFRAYHGHLSSLMEISSHKWKGNIEKWKGEHTILVSNLKRNCFREGERE